MGDLKLVIEGLGRLDWGWCDIDATKGGGITHPCPMNATVVAAASDAVAAMDGIASAIASANADALRGPSFAASAAAELGWGEPLLFNISADPRETTDLANDPGYANALLYMLRRLSWHNSTAVKCRYPPVEPTFDPLATGVLGPFLADGDDDRGGGERGVGVAAQT